MAPHAVVAATVARSNKGCPRRLSLHGTLPAAKAHSAKTRKAQAKRLKLGEKSVDPIAQVLLGDTY
jgi:hypothetical protein